MDQQPANATVETLPQGGQYIITRINGQKKKGRFSVYALSRFMKEKKVTNYFDLLQRMAIGMDLDDYADLIKMSLEDYNRSAPDQAGWTIEGIQDLMDELGGINSDEWRSLIKHAIGRVMDARPAKPDEPKNETEDQKKRESFENSSSLKE